MRRLLDIVCALVILLLLTPVLVIVSMLILAFLGSPVLFFQVRPGIESKPFRIVKFRTMTSERDDDGELLSDAQRLTGLGRFLRSTSLDELPGFWNVLKGDMSLVGPRPLLMEYLPLYSLEQARRHNVRPGITGWAQVNGRNALSWEEKFKLDVWYVDNRTLWLDIKIIFLTIKAVLFRNGVSAGGEATMSKFTGPGS